MKKTLALLPLLFASLALAQVQLGRNVQVGSGAPASSSVSVNGTPVTAPNLNDTTPAASANGRNMTWQVSGSSVSGEIVGDGNVAHFLNGTGGFSTPSGGGGIPYPTITTSVFAGASLGVVATYNTPSATATAVSFDGTIGTVTAANTYTAGQVVVFSGNWSPGCLNWSSAHVLSSGLSGSQFQISEAETILPTYGGCTGVQTGTGGSLNLATGYQFPQITASMPMFNQGGAITPTVYNYSIPGDTLAAAVTNYTARYHAVSPAVTGIPTYFIVQLGGNDISGSCTALAVMQANYMTLWADAHADGYTIIQQTIPGGTTGYDHLGCTTGALTAGQTNGWLLAQSQGQATGTGEYWDHIADVSAYINDNTNANFFQQSGDPSPGHYKPSAALLNAQILNNALLNQGVNTGGIASLGTNYFTGVQNSDNGFNTQGLALVANYQGQLYTAFGNNPTTTGSHLARYYISPSGAPSYGFAAGANLAFMRNICCGFSDLIAAQASLTSDPDYTNHVIDVGDGNTTQTTTGGFALTHLRIQGLSGAATDPVCPNGANGDLTQTGCTSSGGTTTNPLTMNNSGSGDASGSTFDGSAARTISYNTVGATAAAVVPNTLPSPGQLLVGNAGGTAFAPVTASGSCTVSSAGVFTCSVSAAMWASPGAIGSTTPSTGVFTTLNAGQPSLNNAYFGGAGNLTGTGGNNVGIGNAAFKANTTGTINTATGYNALNANTTGSANTATGYNALNRNTTGSGNTATGYNALLNNTTGGNNVADGHHAGYNWNGSNAYFVNNIAESSSANDQAYSLLYGTFSGTAGSLVGQQLTVNGGLKVSVYTVATLPTASSYAAGTMLEVSDATTFTPGTCTGGGSNYMIAITDGTSWSCH